MKEDNVFNSFLCKEELLKKYVAGERNFRRVNLQYAKVQGVNLSEADFGEAISIGAVQKESNLRRAIFRSAKLENADLSHAMLNEADLSNTCLPRLKSASLNITVNMKSSLPRNKSNSVANKKGLTTVRERTERLLGFTLSSRLCRENFLHKLSGRASRYCFWRKSKTK